MSIAAAASAMVCVVLVAHEAAGPAFIALVLCATLAATTAMLIGWARSFESEAQDLALTEKSHRLATMSHELRTPLNGIIGMLSLLAESGLTPHQRNFADTAQSSARTLLSTIDEFLNTAKAENQAEQKTLLDPIALTESVVELLAPRAHAKGIEISARVSAAVPHEIIAHEQSLR